MKRRPNQRRRATKQQERRGVLLLVVLSMLVLFLLVGTTFLVTSGQYRTASKVVEKARRATFQPADLLERALMQVVRDTNNANSTIRYHSLLRDFYGVDGFAGRVYTGQEVTRALDDGTTEQVPAGPRYAGVDPTSGANFGVTQGQVVELYLRDRVLRNDAPAGTPAPGLQAGNIVGLDVDAEGVPFDHQLSSTDGYYEGCLLTMLDGPCRGQSVRILDYDHLRTITEEDFDNTDEGDDIVVVEARLRVIAPRRVDGQPLRFGVLTNDGGAAYTPSQTVLTAFVDAGTVGHRFIVNGRPYNGAGVGYNVLAMAHDLAVPDEAPRSSALERFDAVGAGSYGLERALIPNPVYYSGFSYSLNTAVDLSVGAALDPWNRPSSPATPGVPYAATAFQPITRQFSDAAGAESLYQTFAGPGDTDESYDAADFQNLFLALQSPEPRARGRLVNGTGESVDPDAYYAGGIGVPAPSYVNLDGVTIPSFHRPALTNFWFHRLYNSQWLRNLIGDGSARARMILEPYVNGAARTDVGLGTNAEPIARQIVAIKRKFMMRPLREDHPSFDGSNPLARYGTARLREALTSGNLVNTRDPANLGDDEITFPAWEVVGPWDVDNDGDGVGDSVWVDIGLPVQQTEDGRFYKPLVAMLVEDLDGRLNLNAHGSAEHLAQEDLDPSQTIAPNGDWNANLAQDYVNPRPLFTSNQLPPGSGWGPADISLRPVLSPTLPVDEAIRHSLTAPPLDPFVDITQYDDYARLLRGRPDPGDAMPTPRTVNAAADVSVTWGRYGSSIEAGVLGRSLDRPGATYDDGSPSVRDPLTPLEFLGYHDFLTRNARSGFSTPGDLRGRFAAGLSPLGSSVNEPTDGWREDVAGFPDDSPYELNLAAETRRDAPANADAIRQSYDPNGSGLVDAGTIPLSDDAPYSPAELERILRALDADADTLPDRLWKVVDAFDPEKLVVANEVSNRVRNVGNPDNVVFNPSSLETLIASARAAINRRLVTTDSWDTPSPNENWTHRLIVGADGVPGVPYSDVNGNGARDAGDLGDDDGDGLFDEGDEAIVGYDASGANLHRFSNGLEPTYDQLAADGCDDYVVIMRDNPPNPARITDYLRYRVVYELKRQGRFPADTKHTNATLNAAVTRILFGDALDASETNDDADDLYSFGGLLAPELLAGRRMDLNRPWGDGRDNNGNGVVDEPQEAGEPFVDTNGDGVRQDGEPYLDRNGNGAYDPPEDYVWIDTNRDGVVDAAEQLPFDYTRGADVNGRGAVAGGAPIRDDARLARQLYARHLYCLMLLLMDENYLAPYDPNDPQVRHYLDPRSGEWNSGRPKNPSVAFRLASEIGGRVINGSANNGVDPVNGIDLSVAAQAEVLRDARRTAQLKLTRRAIAQWAINVVDFRDADAIQTPFEYDENPWDGWNVIDTQGDASNENDVVYPLDGDLSTDENYAQRRVVDASGIGAPTPDRASVVADALLHLDRTRGVVWGAERPELLMTEGLAWHDRRASDEDVGGVSDLGANQPRDNDLDQWHKPKGFAFLELYNPWQGDDQRPREFYSYVNRSGQYRDWQGLDTADLAGIRIDRLSNASSVIEPDPSETGSPVAPSPVWRFACVEEHPLLRNSSTLPKNSLSATIDEQLRQWLGYPVVALGDVSDDFETPLNDGYYPGSETELTLDEDSAPWLYQPIERANATNPLDPGPLNAARMFFEERTDQAHLALGTRQVELGAKITDADGVAAPVGVVEVPPTLPSLEWPTFEPAAQPFIAAGGGGGATTVDRIVFKPDPEENLPEYSVDPGVERQQLTKPVCYVERVFYPVTPDHVIGSPPGDPFSTELVPRLLPNLTAPGFRIPRLVYPLPTYNAQFVKDTTLEQSLGIERGIDGPTAHHLHVSKFAPFNVVRQLGDPIAERLFDPDGVSTQPQAGTDYDAATGELFASYETDFAELRPGRRAVVGTTGTVYGRDADPADLTLGTPSFTGSDARRMAYRYAAVTSSSPNIVNQQIGNVAQVGLRRFEMIPSSDEEKHQFSMRLNGSLEVELVNLGGLPFNITAGEGTLRETDTPSISALQPTVAIPIDNFSISEPVDQYLARWLEFDDVGLGNYNYNLSGLPDSNSPAEGFFETPFDEPFDLLPELVENQTTPSYRSIHLQRLANPLLPWNPPPLGPGVDEPDDPAVTATETLYRQHDPRLPVNPYVSVDALSLDVTSYNSYQDPDLDGFETAPLTVIPSPTPPDPPLDVTDVDPYAARHRRARPMTPEETSIGFVSNERARPLGALPYLWAVDVPRLLWRQSQGSTTSELRYIDARSSGPSTPPLSVEPIYNFDNTTPGLLTDPPTRLYEYDRVDLGTRDASLFVDFAWRTTLGFASHFWGEFFSGSDLTWRREAGPGPLAAETIDLDGDNTSGELIGMTEITLAGTGAYADVDGWSGDPATNALSATGSSNGRPDVLDRLLDEQLLDADGNNRITVVEQVDAINNSGHVENATTPELRWPNRPFTSAGELLQVPAWGGSRMLTHFSAFNWLHTQRPGWRHFTQVNPYNGEDGGPGFDHDGRDYGDKSTWNSPEFFDGDFANDNFIDTDGLREAAATNELRFRETLGHFGHLANFFQTARFPAYTEPARVSIAPGPDSADGTADDVFDATIAPRGAAHFYRLLDYVTVPSRFTATAETLNPVVFGEAGLTADDPRVELAAPFNRVDRYREPGRVNLNTVVGRNDETEPTERRRFFGDAGSPLIPTVGDWWSEVYDGIMHRFQDSNLVNDTISGVDYNLSVGNDELLAVGHLGPAWRDVALSRRGYVQATFDPTIDPSNSARLAANAQNQVDYSPRRLNPDFPTLFANPFRSPGEGANVPLARMVQTGVDATLLRAHPLSPGADGAWGQRGQDDNVVDKSGDASPGSTDTADINGVRDDAAEAGILTMTLGGGANPSNVADRLAADVVLARFSDRAAPTAIRGRLPDTFLQDAFRPASNTDNPRDLAPSSGARNTEISRRATPVPLFSGASLEPSQDTERNATMRYQPIERLANLTTTRSGVFAVWITVGLFEVSPAREDARVWPRYLVDNDNDGIGDAFREDLAPAVTAIDLEDLFFRVYPDGYTLGKELDIETGENRRFRGFYLVDRTLPVAFQPGEDANVDNAILLRRRLQ